MSRYIIEFANGDSPIAVDGYLNVEPTLRAKYGSRVEIGHNGDLPDGGERTMFWANKKDAANDDGVNALGEVRKATVDEIDPLVMFASIERAKDALAQAEGRDK